MPRAKHELPMQIVIVGLLIIDYAGPMKEKLVILGALLLGGFSRRDDRKILLNIGDLNLKGFARESHILLGSGDMAGEPEEKVRTGDVGERIAKSYVAPVDNAPIAVRGDDDVSRIEVAVAERLAARHRLKPHVKIVEMVIIKILQ